MQISVDINCAKTQFCLIFAGVDGFVGCFCFVYPKAIWFRLDWALFYVCAERSCMCVCVLFFRFVLHQTS